LVVRCVGVVRNPSEQTRGFPRHPVLTASQFCGIYNGLEPSQEDAGQADPS